MSSETIKEIRAVAEEVRAERRRIVGEIAEVLRENISGAMLRIKVLAIVEGRDVPDGRQPFVALGLRAGVSRSQCYKTWDELYPDDEDEPEETALYHIYGEADLLLYVGISNNFGQRWRQHARTQPWWSERRRMATVWFDSRPDAEAAEEAAIKTEHPKYNKQHTERPAA